MMKTKNYLLLILCVIFTTPLFSQGFASGKGSIWLSGTGSFTSSGGDMFEDYDENRLTSISLVPAVNYFVFNNVFVGGAFEVSTQSQGDYKNTGFGVGPQVGYVIGNENSKLLPYLSAGVKLMSQKSDYGNYGDSKASGSDIALGAGIVLPVKGHVGIVVEGGYHMTKLKNKDEDESYSGNIISVGIGIVGLLFGND